MRSVLLVVVVAVISLLAGVAVTGLPTSVPDDVVSSEISVTSAKSTTTTTAPRAPTTIKAGSSPPNPSDTAATVLAPITSLRVIVASAGSAAGAAGRIAGELRTLGYTNVSATDARTARADTVVAFAPGFGGDATRLAGQLGLSMQQVAPSDAAALTVNAPADIWVILGRDQV